MSNKPYILNDTEKVYTKHSTFDINYWTAADIEKQLPDNQIDILTKEVNDLASKLVKANQLTEALVTQRDDLTKKLQAMTAQYNAMKKVKNDLKEIIEDKDELIKALHNKLTDARSVKEPQLKQEHLDHYMALYEGHRDAVNEFSRNFPEQNYFGANAQLAHGRAVAFIRDYIKTYTLRAQDKRKQS